MKIYRAYYDSRNFDFEAYSDSEEMAREKCLEALKTHGVQYKLEPDWFMFDEIDGIECSEFNMNTPYRDRSEL